MEALITIAIVVALYLLLKAAIKGTFSKKSSGVTVRVSERESGEYVESKARKLLKESTALKKEKKYEEACERLQQAYALADADDLTIADQLRLPMYLQLAGRSDEGWSLLNEINNTITDVFSQVDIAKQMRIFLQKEKKFSHAIVFGLWEICKSIERDRDNIKHIFKLTDSWAKDEEEYGSFDSDDRKEKIYTRTPKGNPVTDSSYEMFSDRIKNDMSLDGVKKSLLPHLKKAKAESSLDALSEASSQYLQLRKKYEFKSVQELTVKHMQA
jgi:hypothetical protein